MSYQYFVCDGSPSNVPDIVLVSEASKVKWFAQVHNTLAIEGLELTTLRL